MADFHHLFFLQLSFSFLFIWHDLLISLLPLFKSVILIAPGRKIGTNSWLSQQAGLLTFTKQQWGEPHTNLLFLLPIFWKVLLPVHSSAYVLISANRLLSSQRVCCHFPHSKHIVAVVLLDDNPWPSPLAYAAVTICSTCKEPCEKNPAYASLRIHIVWLQKYPRF